MPSQFNITLTSFTLKCGQANLEPNYKIVFPDRKKFVSKEASQNHLGDYIWQDRATFAYLSDRNNRIDKYFVRIAFSDKEQFIGDVDIDLLTLVTGPMRFELPLGHGFNNCRVTFIVTSIEYIKSQIKIENLTIEGLEKDDWGVRVRLASKNDRSVVVALTSKGDKFIQEIESIFEDVLSYKDLQTDMELEIFRRSNNIQYDLVKFGIQKLYVHDQLEYTLNTSAGHAVTLLLSLINKPLYVQALSGIYQGYGRYNGYIHCNGSYEVNINNNDLIKFNEPIAQPSEGCIKTFKPFVSKVSLKTLKITGKNLPRNLMIKARNTINNKREKITLNFANDAFSCENFHFMQLDIKKPYQLNRRYLIWELVTEEDKFVGDIYLNLHNLFCGPPQYVVNFDCEGGAQAKAEFTIDVVNGRNMKVKFTNFTLDATDQNRDCYLKFGFVDNELRYDVAKEENGKLIYEGEYDVQLYYSTASKNIQAYVINVMLVEKKLLKDSVKFSAKYPLMKILPFKTQKTIEIPFEQNNIPHFFCEINMNTSSVKPGLYGEYQLLEGGVFDNGVMDFSTFREVETFTEFCQPPYFPAIINDKDKSIKPISTDSLDKVECSVLSGADNEDKVIVLLTDKDITMTKLDGTIILTHPLNTNLQSSCNTNQLTLITPTSHTQLYTKRARDIKAYIDSHTTKAVASDRKQNVQQGYYVLCSMDCKGAISVTCPVCSFHPNDFEIQYYGVAHCDICSYETYVHFKDDEEVEISCPMCESTLRTLEDTLQQSYICSCGFPLGSVCKRCGKVPTFDAPKVYVRTLCGECGQIQLINEELTNSVPCTKCKSSLEIAH